MLKIETYVRYGRQSVPSPFELKDLIVHHLPCRKGIRKKWVVWQWVYNLIRQTSLTLQLNVRRSDVPFHQQSNLFMCAHARIHLYLWRDAWCFCFPCRAQCNLSAGILRMRKSIRSCHVGFGQQFAAGAFRIYLQLILSRRRQKRSQDQDASTLTRAADANIPADDDGKMFRIVSRLRIEERHPRPPTASEKS